MQKKAFSKRDMHSLKRNISFHRFAAVGSADVSGRYSVLSSPSCRNLVSYYTNKNIAVSYLRARKKNDLERVMRLYGNETSKYW